MMNLKSISCCSTVSVLQTYSLQLYMYIPLCDTINPSYMEFPKRCFPTFNFPLNYIQDWHPDFGSGTTVGLSIGLKFKPLQRLEQ